MLMLDENLTMAEPKQSVLVQMLQQNDDKHEAAHQRIRNDHRSLEGRVTALETAQVANAIHFARLDNKPVDATELQFTTRTVLGIVFFCVALAGGQ